MTNAVPDQAPDLPEMLNALRGELAERLGIEIVAATQDRVEATMPVEGNRQPYGLLHGGASCVLAESVASLGSALHAYPDRIALGIEINATHHRSVSSGVVHAVATVIRAGRSLASWNVTITDASGEPVCTSRVTCFLRPGS